MSKFLDVGLLATQCQRHNTTDMHVGAIYMHCQLQLFADGLDVLKTFLEIWPCAANPD